MNSSGISRKIDELGRIVIPVEIRRQLNINEGESIEFVISNDALCLKKINVVTKYKESIEKIGKTLSNVIKCNYLITDRDKVIISSNTNLIGKKITDNIKSYLNVHEDSVLYSKDYGINSNLYLYPYYEESSIAGFLIFYDVDNIINYKLLARYICTCIHELISLS